MTAIDQRDALDIIVGPHAIATLWDGTNRLVRGVDRFTHLPTRERAAVVWVQRTLDSPTVQSATVPLADIALYSGAAS